MTPSIVRILLREDLCGIRDQLQVILSPDYNQVNYNIVLNAVMKIDSILTGRNGASDPEHGLCGLGLKLVP